MPQKREGNEEAWKGQSHDRRAERGRGKKEKAERTAAATSQCWGVRIICIWSNAPAMLSKWVLSPPPAPPLRWHRSNSSYKAMLSGRAEEGVQWALCEAGGSSREEKIGSYLVEGELQWYKCLDEMCDCCGHGYSFMLKYIWVIMTRCDDP